MISFAGQFIELLSRIGPSRNRRHIVREIFGSLHRYMRSCKLISAVKPYSCLAGSYARNTAIRNIKDVDITVFVDPRYRSNDAKHILRAMALALEDWPLMAANLNIRKVYPKRHSVHVFFEKMDVDIDIVPGIIKERVYDPLWIPDEDINDWVEADHFGYARYLVALNKAHDNKVIPLIRLLKHWRDVQLDQPRPKSFWLECMLIHGISKGEIITTNKGYGELFNDSLTHFHALLAPNLEISGSVPEIPDPMLGNNVAYYWTRDGFESFMSAVHESQTLAKEALLIGDKKENDAITLWQKVFNTETEIFFPSTI